MRDINVDPQNVYVKAILKAVTARRDKHRNAAASIKTELKDVPHLQGRCAECEWLIGQLEMSMESE